MDVKKIHEYLKLRNKFFSKYINGLHRSKGMCMKTGEWTELDELELTKAKFRKKELEHLAQVFLGKKPKFDIDYFIAKVEKKIMEMDNYGNNRKT